MTTYWLQNESMIINTIMELKNKKGNNTNDTKVIILAFSAWKQLIAILL